MIDAGFNGYRDVILPFAETDTLVRRAIVLVADQHLSMMFDISPLLGPSDYISLVRDLVTQSSTVVPHEDETTMATLLLLQIQEIISGSHDFTLVYCPLRTLVSNTDFLTANANCVLSRFVKMQVLR